MAGSSLRGPGRIGSGILDEGKLTERVVGVYAQERGDRGQEAASLVFPARLRLWRAVEDHMPQDLAEGLLDRCSTADATTRGGILELRQAVAEWLRPTPKCGCCGRVYRRGQACTVREVGASLPDMFPTDAAATRRAPRRKMCRPSRAMGTKTPTLLSPHLNIGVRQAMTRMVSLAAEKKKSPPKGPLEILVDRDGRILMSVSEGPGVPEPVRKARKAFDALLSDAILANGRLVIAVQRQFYSACGSITRADLTQGGALGCRRGLMDYDASQASFASYSIQWIRRGILTVFSKRDLVGTPDDLASKRRRVEFLGLDPHEVLAGLVDACHGLLSPLLTALRSVLVADPIASKESLGKVLLAAAHLTEERRLLKLAGWAASRIDEGHARRTMMGGKAKTGAHRRKAPPKRSPLGGAGLLSALRHGSSMVVSLSHEEGSREEQAQRVTANACDPLAIDLEDPEETHEERQAQAEQHTHFLLALAEVRLSEPEAAEVVRRHHGLDGVESETLEQIASSPLRCTGRKVSRESVRLLGERGQAKLRLHLQALGVGVPSDPPPPPMPPPRVTIIEEREANVVLGPPALPIPSIVKVVDAGSWDSFRSDLGTVRW